MTTKKNIQAENKKQHQKRKNTKTEREKAFEKVQGMSIIDPSIFDTTAYCIIEDDSLKKTLLLVLSTVVTFDSSAVKNQMC